MSRDHQENLKQNLSLALELLADIRNLDPEQEADRMSIVYSRLRFAALNAKCALNMLYKNGNKC